MIYAKLTFGALLTSGLVVAGCSYEVCDEFYGGTCPPYVSANGGGGGNGGSAPTTTTTMGSTSSSSTDGGGGMGGTGGNVPCDGACQVPTPLCNEATDMCVACLSDNDCDSVDASHCNAAGACVPCSSSGECSHLTGTTVCDVGTCVECKLGEETACVGGTTCDLLAKECTGPGAGSVTNCKACTNDSQCSAGHRCIPMDFDGSAHGYYCLKDAAAGCARPFQSPINQASISGAAATNYCGIDEDVASCEAVLALINGWVCSGTDGMCSPDGIQPEVATPGALCRQVGLAPNQCTYECGGVLACLSSGPGSTCAGMPSPTWCGG